MICVIAHMARRAHQDSDLTAIYDWLVLGLSTGVQRVEYAQTKCTKIEMVWVQLDQHNPNLNNLTLLLMEILRSLTKIAAL